MNVEERVSILERVLSDYVIHHEVIHELEDSALELRTSDLERRLVEMNQFRKQIDEERGAYITRSMYDERHESLIERISSLEKEASNFRGRMYVTGIVMSIFVALITVVANFLVKTWK